MFGTGQVVVGWQNKSNNKAVGCQKDGKARYTRKMIIIGQNSNNNNCRLLGPIGPHGEKTIRFYQ